MEEDLAPLWIPRNQPGFKTQLLQNISVFPGYSPATLEKEEKDKWREGEKGEKRLRNTIKIINITTP